MSMLRDISNYIQSGETKSERLGLEVEHFIVDSEGKQITFDKVVPLIEQIGKKKGDSLILVDGHVVGYSNNRYSITLEPSCQFEISINPRKSLSEIRAIYDEFISTWEPVFNKMGYRFITKGNLPLVEQGIITPDDIPLSPKKRYEYMDAYFRNTGKCGRYMMRASASTQLSVDYKSEEDLVRKLNVLQKISPLLMIMFESKVNEDSTLPGVIDKPHLFRIQEWDDLDDARTGFFPYSLDEDFGYDKMAEVIYNMPLILLTDESKTIDVGSKSAKDLLDENMLVEEEINLSPERKKALIEHFLSMGFFHFRVKKYIEIRVVDSVPIDRALGFCALVKGIVYSEDNLKTLEKELESVDSIEKIREAVEKIEVGGLDAVIYDNKIAKAWATHIIKLAEKSLPIEERKYLTYV